MPIGSVFSTFRTYLCIHPSYRRLANHHHWGKRKIDKSYVLTAGDYETIIRPRRGQQQQQHHQQKSIHYPLWSYKSVHHNDRQVVVCQPMIACSLSLVRRRTHKSKVHPDQYATQCQREWWYISSCDRRRVVAPASANRVKITQAGWSSTGEFCACCYVLEPQLKSGKLENSTHQKAWEMKINTAEACWRWSGRVGRGNLSEANVRASA